MHLIAYFSNLKHTLAKPGARQVPRKDGVWHGLRYIQDQQVSCNLYYISVLSAVGVFSVALTPVTVASLMVSAISLLNKQ